MRKKLEGFCKVSVVGEKTEYTEEKGNVENNQGRPKRLGRREVFAVVC